MSSNCCPVCFFPVYLIIPGASVYDTSREWEYTCLYSDCINFKVSMPESAVIINSDGQVSDAVDYPSWPLEQQLPVYNSAQTWFTQPYPPQSMHQEFIAVGQAGPGPATAARLEEQEPRCKKTPAKKGGKKDSDLTTREKRYGKWAQTKKFHDLPNLEKPLSELSNSEGSDPMTKITSYANRSIECRHEEAKLVGRVKRPHNPFILYRMAFKGAALMKDLPHYKVSSVVGQSWAMESARVRDQFVELAANERDLHAQAFPDYKFNPHSHRKVEGKELDSE